MKIEKLTEKTYILLSQDKKGILRHKKMRI